VLFAAAIGLGEIDVAPQDVLKHVFTDESPFRGGYVGHESCQKVDNLFWARYFAWDGDHQGHHTQADEGDHPLHESTPPMPAVVGNGHLLYG